MLRLQACDGTAKNWKDALKKTETIKKEVHMPTRSCTLFTMLVVVLILFISANLVDAGGGVNHKVKVRNKTSCSMKVYLFTYNGDSYGPKESSGFDEVKFETGAKCPDR